MKRSFYYVIAALSGYIILGLEILGFRLLAPYFGYSLYVSGALIGVMLFSLSIGYWLGGFLADKNVREKTVLIAIFGAGIYSAGMAMFSERILEAFSSYGLVSGPFIASLILFALPTIILALLSPYLIKLLLGEEEGIGMSAGGIYAFGTVGSLAGNFVTALYIVPTFGAYIAFLSDVFLIFFIVFLWSIEKRSMPLVLFSLSSAALVPFFILTSPHLRPPVIAEYDSPYTKLQVVDYGKFIALRTGTYTGTIYSYVPKGDKWQGISHLYDTFADLPRFNKAKTALILGFGTGTLANLYQETTPGLSVTGVEIDLRIIDVGRRYFRLNDAKNVSDIVIDDVRPYLRTTDGRYDIITIDLFREAEIPFYVATQEFFELTARHLTPNGIMAMNIYDPSSGGKIISPIVNTIASVYPYLTYLSFPLGPRLIVASRSDPMLYQKISSLGNATHVSFNPTEKTFTDDWAPIELLSYQAIFSR